MTRKEKLQEIIEAVEYELNSYLKVDYDFDLSDIKPEDIPDSVILLEDLKQFFTDYIWENPAFEFIYYDDAIDYLKANDASLIDAFEYARDFGEIKDSCQLATIHLKYKALELVEQVLNRFEDNLEDDEEEEEEKDDEDTN